MFQQKGLHFIHLNVKSLLLKIDENRLISIQTRAACLCISETWLVDSILESETDISNYTIRRKDINRHGGGVCMYVRSNIAFNACDDLNHEELEATWIDILLPKTKRILCGVLYRPPNQSNFYQVLESVCSNIIKCNNAFCLMILIQMF